MKLAPNSRTRSGFTLIELIIAIAVVGILAGVLLRTLGRAQREALSIKCRSNLRNLAQAMHMYAVSHGGCLPFPGDVEASAVVVRSVLQPFADADRVFSCPGGPEPELLPEGSYDWRGTDTPGARDTDDAVARDGDYYAILGPLDVGEYQYAIDAIDADNSPESSQYSRTFEVLPGIEIDDVSLTEGNDGTRTFNFTVSLSEPSAQTITVDYATEDGTATVADNDYETAGDTLTFVPDDTTETIAVTVNGDDKYELDDTFYVTLSNPSNATLADGQGVGTIENDDPEPEISIGDFRSDEGDSPSRKKVFSFDVTLSNPSWLEVSVDYATADGTATAADNDYVPKSGPLTFNPGDTSPADDLQVLVPGDKNYELDETFDVNLSSPVNAALGDGQGTGTIENGDPRPSVTVKLRKGDLVVLGSKLPEAIEITQGANANEFIVTGLDFTQVNGQGVVTIAGVKDDFRISMRGGEDTVRLDSLTVPDKLILKTGSGNDHVEVTNVNVRGTTNINTGWGNDSVVIDPTEFRRNARIKTGSGADLVTLAEAAFKRRGWILTGSGADTVTVSESDFLAKVNVKTGSGDDTVRLENNSTFAARCDVKTSGGADHVWVTQSSFDKKLKLILGGGSDWLTEENCVLTEGGLAKGGPRQGHVRIRRPRHQLRGPEEL